MTSCAGVLQDASALEFHGRKVYGLFLHPRHQMLLGPIKTVLAILTCCNPFAEHQNELPENDIEPATDQRCHPSGAAIDQRRDACRLARI